MCALVLKKPVILVTENDLDVRASKLSIGALFTVDDLMTPSETELYQQKLDNRKMLGKNFAELAGRTKQYEKVKQVKSGQQYRKVV
jgi:hypothetical protein